LIAASSALLIVLTSDCIVSPSLYSHLIATVRSSRPASLLAGTCTAAPMPGQLMVSSSPPLPCKTLPSVYANCRHSCRRAGVLPYWAVRASFASF
jgi:hypothetical protein